MSDVWQYRTFCLPGLEVAKALNDAGQEGYTVLFVNHSFQGPDASGVAYVVMGRRAPFEIEETPTHSVHAVVLPPGTVHRGDC